MGLLLFVLAQTAPASITVFTDSVIATFHGDILGSGSEINVDMSDAGVDSLARFSGTRVIRFGGIASEYYAWDENNFLGRMYFDWFDTTLILDMDWGVDQFMAFCDSVGAEPLVCVNTQLNDPGYAADLVEYCNGDTSTYYGWLRAVRGHPEPYHVKLWGLGNEQDIAGNYFPPWGTTFYRHFGIPFSEWSDTDSVYVTPEAYARLVREYSDSMRATSPEPIEIVAPSLAGDLSWMGPVLDSSADYIDWVDVHLYPVWGEIPYDQILAAPDTGTLWAPSVDEYISGARDTIEAHAGGRPIRLLLGEWNSGADLDTPIDMFWWNYLDGLFYADVVGHLLNLGLSWSCFYSIYNNTDVPEFNYIRNDTVSLRCVGWVMKMIDEHPGDYVVRAISDKPDPGRGLETYAWFNGGEQYLYVLVVNQNPDTSYQTVVRWTKIANHWRHYKAWQITHDTTLAAPFNGTTGIVYSESVCGLDSLLHTFPPYSVTLLGIESSAGVSEKLIRPGVFLEARPVPSQGFVSIAYSVPDEGPVKIRIFDPAGRTVCLLVHRKMKPGTYTLSWKPEKPGIYFLEMTTEGARRVKKLVFPK